MVSDDARSSSDVCESGSAGSVAQIHSQVDSYVSALIVQTTMKRLSSSPPRQAGRQAGRLARRREAAQKQRSPCLPLERVLVFDAPTRGLPPDTMHAMPTATREAGRGGGATDGCLGASPIFRGARQPCEDFRRAHRRKTGGRRASSTGVHHESSLTAEPPPAARGTLGNRARHSTANQGSDF